MPRYNNQKPSRRMRGRSCPAGVCFTIRNDITNFGALRKSKSTNLCVDLEKEHNLTRPRRQSFPKVLSDDSDANDERFATKASLSSSYLHSELTGGIVHNLFRRKLANAHKLTRSLVDVSNQDSALNNLSPAHRCFDADIVAGCDEVSSPENVCTSHTKVDEKQCETIVSCLKQSVHYQSKDDNENILFDLLTASEHTDVTLTRIGKHLEKSSSCSELNQNPALCEVSSSPNELDEQDIKEDNEILSFGLLKEASRKSLSNVDDTQIYLHNSFLNSSDNLTFEEQTFPAKKERINYFDTLRDQQNTGNTQNALSSLNDQHLDNFLSRFLQGVNRLEVIDFEDSQPILSDPGITTLTHSDIARLENRVQQTEFLVDTLASQVEDAKNESEMSKQKQENEINDLILLNEEMQTIWSAKETEVREILERFSTYRDAVEADANEKDEIYSEEINKRDMIIKNLQLSKNALQEELAKQTGALKNVLDDIQHFEATQIQQLGDVNELVACLLETFTDQEASSVCQSINVKLETSIASIKEKDYSRYISFLDVSGTEAHSSEEIKRNYKERKLGKSFSSSVDEGTGFSILSSTDGERNEYMFTDNAVNESALSNELVSPEQFLSEDFRSFTPVATANDEFYETMEEDFGRLLEEVDEIGNEGLVEGYITKKAVVKLLEDQWSKYHFICKEKDAEIQHWIRKHKQDTENFQSILEEQERAEAKSSESLAELQSEMDKLRQRNKFLESEVEFAKEQGEDDVSYLKESFQKDLSAQLRRQSQSFLFVEENTRSQLAELESKNEELEKSNEVLKREIEDHCTEIKSWVFDILRVSEKDYNDESLSITDVFEKLHRVIITNKRTMDELQEELKEYKMKVYEPSPPDTLSRSWGGHSLNSMELQKELCRNCKQTKWQRLLMGSFDLADSSLEVKQDEVESFFDKLSVDDPKCRKRRSLRDSLELADDQLEHLQRLSRQEFGSLDTLGEDSLEESDGRNSDDVVDGQSDSKLGDHTCQSSVECGDEVVDGQSDAECGDEVVDGQSNAECEDEMSNLQSNAECGEEMSNGQSDAKCGDEVVDGQSNAEFRDGQSNAECEGEMSNLQSNTECRDGMSNSVARETDNFTNKTDGNCTNNGAEDTTEDDDECWKNIHVSPRLSTQYSIQTDPELTGSHNQELNLENNESGEKENMDSGPVRTSGEGRQLEMICEDVNDEQWLIDEGSKEQEDQDRVNVVNLYRSLVDSPQPTNVVDGSKGGGFDGESGEEDGECGDQTRGKFGELNHDDNQMIVSSNVSFPIPKIIVGKDFNENFLETEDQESDNVEESYFNEISETLKSHGESSDTNGEYGAQVGKSRDESSDRNLNFSIPKNEEILMNEFEFKEDFQAVLKNEIIIKNIVKPQSKISKSWSISADPKNVIFESVEEDLGNGTVSSTSCAHCCENLENFKTKLIEVISNYRKDEENKIFRELEETKLELRELQSDHEKLNKLCEDYRNYVDEYSGNLKRKTEELSKLKLGTGIMRTEIEWLRQALGITGSYTEF